MSSNSSPSRMSVTRGQSSANKLGLSAIADAHESFVGCGPIEKLVGIMSLGTKDR